MTTRFFPGSHDPDADNLNTLLDAMRSGMRAPDPALTSEEAADLARSASQFRALDDRARAAAGATDTTVDSIWEDMMSAYAVANPTPFADDSPKREERINQRVISIPPRPTFGWWNSLLSAAIVALMLVGLIAAAWTLRETGGSDPGDDIRLAATALDGTPEIDENNPWLQPISAEDCVEPYANSPLAATGVYQPASTPALSDAEAVAEAARLYEACGSGDISQQRLPIRDRWQVYFNTNASPSPNSARDIMVQHQLDVAKTLSPLLTSQNPADYIHTTDAGLELNPDVVFLPSQAMQLADGRIAIPISYLVPSNEDSTPTDLYSPWPSTNASNLAIEIQIFRQTDKTWVLDEKTPWGCIGNCEGSWDQLSQQLSLSTPSAIQEASPVAVDNWWSWASAEECVPEDFPDRNPMDADPEGADWDWAEDQFIPFTQPAPQDAEAVASLARVIEACKQAGIPFAQLQSDRYFRSDALQDPNYLANYYHLSQEISDAFPLTDPEDFVRTTTDEMVFATPSAMMRRAGLVRDPLPFVYIPDQAVELADGRIGIPTALLLNEGESHSDGRLDALERGLYVGSLLIFTNEGGEWLLDGELRLCIGDCDPYWEYQQTVFDLPATPPASPVATPEG